MMDKIIAILLIIALILELMDVPNMRRGMSRMMTLEKAIEILRANYERALKMEYVTKPLSWALYYTWREIDKEEKHK